MINCNENGAKNEKNRSQRYDINRHTIVHKISEKNSRFYVKLRTKVKVHFLFSRRFFRSTDKSFISGRGMITVSYIKIVKSLNICVPLFV